MHVIPFLNLLDGQCVGLAPAAGQSEPFVEKDPVVRVQRLEEAGAKWLHVVDLNGAKNQKLQQVKTIETIARHTSIHLQIGGGVRTEADIKDLLSAGADRVVVGSMAIFDPTQVGNWITHLGREKVMLALDVRLSSSGIPEVLIKGWVEGSALSLWDVLTAYKGSGLKTILCTDVQRGGALSGANQELYSQIRQVWSELNVIAAGGVNGFEDLEGLARIGVYGTIIGRALHEKRIDLNEAVRRFQK